MYSRIALYITHLVVSIVELMIGLRVLLKLFGASSSAPFVTWVYQTSEPLLTPFSGMFPAPEAQGRFVLEFSALFALVVYALVGYAVETILAELAYHVHTVEKKNK